MPTTLYDLEIDEVSLVKAGDNPEAKMIMTKMLKAPMKTEGGTEYPAEAYAYVPDPETPSTWKLRLWESPEAKITPAQVGRAVAALGPGFRGNKVQIPADALDEVKRKVAEAFKAANPDRELPQILKKGESMKYNQEQLAAMQPEELIALIMEMQVMEGQEEMEEGEAMKSLPENIRKQLEAKEADVKKALDEKEAMLKAQEARIEKMEKEAVRKDLTSKAESFIIPDMTKEQIVDNLVKAHEAGVLKELELAYEATTKARKDSELLKEKGAPGDSNGATEFDKINAMAKEIRVNDPKLSEQQAFAKAHAILKKGQ